MTAEEAREFVARLCPDIEVTGPATPLSGGFMNQVWSVPAEPKPVIVKYAPPYITAAPDIPLDDRRILIEAQCLELFSLDKPLHHLATAAARPPAILAKDAWARVIVMEDVGRHPDLNTYLKSAGTPGKTGRDLGNFIGLLHTTTAANKTFERAINNLSIQHTRRTVQYDAIGSLCRKAGYERAEIAGRQASELGQRLLSPGKCIIMGDLWPASILVGPDGIRLIDWEFAHFGIPAQDVAHLAAHLWMLAHRYPGLRQPIDDFWLQFQAAYDAAIRPNQKYLWPDQVVRDAGIHFGAEILVRTVGAFQAGYLYEGLDLASSVVQEAVQTAGAYLVESERWKDFSIRTFRGFIRED